VSNPGIGQQNRLHGAKVEHRHGGLFQTDMPASYQHVADLRFIEETTASFVVDMYVHPLHGPRFMDSGSAENSHGAACRHHQGDECLQHFAARYPTLLFSVHYPSNIFFMGSASLSISPAPAVISSSGCALFTYARSPSLLNTVRAG